MIESGRCLCGATDCPSCGPAQGICPGCSAESDQWKQAGPCRYCGNESYECYICEDVISPNEISYWLENLDDADALLHLEELPVCKSCATSTIRASLHRDYWSYQSMAEQGLTDHQDHPTEYTSTKNDYATMWVLAELHPSKQKHNGEAP